MATMGKTVKFTVNLALMTTLVSANSAYAGRPITVDDAGVDEVGKGHIDAWYARDASASNTYTMMPSVGIANGLELDAILSRNASNRINTLGAQLKVLFTPSEKAGCNLGATLGATRSTGSGDAVNTPFVNGLFTCNQGSWALHLNAGAAKASGSKTLGTWGVALEETVADNWTGHVEIFGQQEGKPTTQFGLKKTFGNWQIDGTIGRTDGIKVYTFGTKFSF